MGNASKDAKEQKKNEQKQQAKAMKNM